MTEPSSPEASLRPLEHSWSDYPCEARLADVLQVEVTEVLGSSPVVAPGKSYLVRGEYVLSGPEVAWLCLSCQGTSRGRKVALDRGRGEFEISAEALEVAAGKERILDILMADSQGKHLGVRARIELKE